MWTVLLSLLKGPLSSISNDLKEAYESKLKAQNDKERMAADERIAILEARKSVIMASQANPVDRVIRPLIALPFVIYINKLVLWDKVLSWGTTDALSPELSYILSVVIAGYFVDGIVKRIKS